MRYRLIILVIMFAIAGPLWVLLSGQVDLKSHWRQADRARTGLAADPEDFQPALIQLYAARAYNWRGAMSVHMWFATKAPSAKSYTVYQVLGWNAYYGRSVVDIKQGMPDHKWFNHPPWIVGELKGLAAEKAIKDLKQAVKSYPYADLYQMWPGPNSNTFIAYVLRRIPNWPVAMPANAIGKDFIAFDRIFAKTPSKTGVQWSLWGLMGVSISSMEGLEINLFGLTYGLDWQHPAIKLPGMGRIGVTKTR
jgi:hypothetical protein